jgi:hypothetical protein
MDLKSPAHGCENHPSPVQPSREQAPLRLEPDDRERRAIGILRLRTPIEAPQQIGAHRRQQVISIKIFRKCRKDA